LGGESAYGALSYFSYSYMIFMKRSHAFKHCARLECVFVHGDKHL